MAYLSRSGLGTIRVGSPPWGATPAAASTGLPARGHRKGSASARLGRRPRVVRARWGGWVGTGPGVCGAGGLAGGRGTGRVRRGRSARGAGGGNSSGRLAASPGSVGVPSGRVMISRRVARLVGDRARTSAARPCGRPGCARRTGTGGGPGPAAICAPFRLVLEDHFVGSRFSSPTFQRTAWLPAGVGLEDQRGGLGIHDDLHARLRALVLGGKQLPLVSSVRTANQYSASRSARKVK